MFIVSYPFKVLRAVLKNLNLNPGLIQSLEKAMVLLNHGVQVLVLPQLG